MTKNLSDWLSYIQTLHPQVIDLGLSRVKQVGESLNVLEFAYPVITVAGTNGKGSVIQCLETILLTAGYRVGTYTSPHLLEYSERVRLNGKNVSEALLSESFAKIEAARGQISLTYFEFSTLAALQIFQEQSLDVVLLEVGLGGRLDAVNCVDADLTIITTIDFDHMEWLGDSIEAIAEEKAGIMRANTPIIFGDTLLPNAIKTKAQNLNSPLYYLGKDFSFRQNNNDWSWQSASLTLQKLPLPKLYINNAATALMAIELAKRWFSVNESAIISGLKNTTISGRFQWLDIAKPTLVDVAHNPQAARCLAQKLQEKQTEIKTAAVVGILTDKNLEGILNPFLHQVETWYVANLNVPRGGSAKRLANYLLTQKVTESAIKQFDTVEAAYEQALNDVANQRIIVFGSFYTVEEVIRFTDSRRVL